MTAETFTNTSLGTARRCFREYDLRYDQQLELDGDDREVLQVGHTWHRAFDVEHKGGNPYAAIAEHAPGEKWAEKLRRLYAGHEWRWQDEPLELVEAEHTFKVEFGGYTFEGERDGILQTADGRRGVLERKTSGEDIGPTASYWDRLRLDTQVGLYALTMDPRPDFILYDVTRKPTINPKALTKADQKRLRAELEKDGTAVYFQETFTAEQLANPLEEGRESLALYGARLTADIGDQPEKYFARRPIDRTKEDFDHLLEDLLAQVQLIEHAHEIGHMPRNPDSCRSFGLCDFFGHLCSNNVRPVPGHVPDGFRRREHRHPELAKPQGHAQTS